IAYLTKNPSRTDITRSQIRSITRTQPLINLGGMFQKAAYGLGAGCTLGFALYYGQAHFLNRGKGGGESEIAQTAPKALQQQRGLAAAAPPMRQRFEPKQTRGFKKSYTDNALYTTLYIEAELNSEFRSLWLTEVEKAAKAD